MTRAFWLFFLEVNYENQKSFALKEKPDGSLQANDHRVKSPPFCLKIRFFDKKGVNKFFHFLTFFHMKNFEELSEMNGKRYVIKNQAVEFALEYNPCLPLKVKRAYLIDGKFFGLISIGNIFHMITEKNAFYVGVSYSVACQKLDTPEAKKFFGNLFNTAAREFIPEYYGAFIEDLNTQR